MDRIRVHVGQGETLDLDPFDVMRAIHEALHAEHLWNHWPTHIVIGRDVALLFKLYEACQRYVVTTGEGSTKVADCELIIDPGLEPNEIRCAYRYGEDGINRAMRWSGAKRSVSEAG